MLIQPSAVVRTLVSRVSAGSRASMAALSALGVAARLGVVATAVAISRGDARLAVIAGPAVAVLYGVQRAVQARLRIRVECELYGAAASALVRSDVLDVPERDPSHVLFGGAGQARVLLVDGLPALLADALTCLVVAPLVVSELPARVLVVAALGLVLALGVVVSLRRATDAVQARALERYQEVVDALLVAVEGRLELVARGGEEAYATALASTLASYARVAERAALGLALLGRAPLLLAIAAVGAAVAIDGALREVLVAAVLAQALVLAAILPAFLGIVSGVYEVVRAATPSRELVELLARPEREELRRQGDAPPPGATVLALESASLAYAEGEPPAVRDLSLRWAPGAALLLTGANGSGKTTVLRMLLGLRAPTSGLVALGGRPLCELDVVALRRRIAFLPQRPYVGEPYATVRFALALACPDASDAQMLSALTKVGLSGALDGRAASPLDVRVGELSAGQRQRVALARVILQDAQLVLLDEPEANLDREGVALVSSVVDGLVADGKMVAVAAHATSLGERVERVELGQRA